MTFLILTGLLCWAAAIRALTAPFDPGSHMGPCSPEEKVLFDRFARGKIDDDEYRTLRELLRSTTGHTAGGDSRPQHRGRYVRGPSTVAGLDQPAGCTRQGDQVVDDGEADCDERHHVSGRAPCRAGREPGPHGRDSADRRHPEEGDDEIAITGTGDLAAGVRADQGGQGKPEVSEYKQTGQHAHSDYREHGRP